MNVIPLRKLLQRTGILDESTAPLPTDSDAVVRLLAAPWYDERLNKLADELGRDPDSVRAEAACYLREMAPTLDERAINHLNFFPVTSPTAESCRLLLTLLVREGPVQPAGCFVRRVHRPVAARGRSVGRRISLA